MDQIVSKCRQCGRLIEQWDDDYYEYCDDCEFEKNDPGSEPAA